MRFWITLLYLLVVLVLAFRRGEQPERLTAAILVAGFAVDLVYHLIFGHPEFVTVDPVHFSIDATTLVVLMGIALRANRGWTLWAASAQLIVMLGHLGKIFEMRDVYRGYWAMTQVPILLQLAFLLIGTLAHIARSRRIGIYASWRPT